MRRLDGLLQGDYRTLMRGAGLDLADLREYQHHDDVRHIDWNVTARLQTPYVRQFTEDRELVGLVPGRPRARASTSARASCTKRTRRARVRRRAGAAADAPRQPRRRAALRQRRRHRDPGARRPPPRAATCCSGWRARPAEAPAGATDLRELLLGRRSASIKRRSTVFVVSDFISAPGWERAAGQLAQRHEVTAVRLFDPLEMDLPDLGLVTMRDAETGEQIVVDTHDAGFRKRFAAAAAAARRRAARGARPRRRRHARARAPTTTWSTRCCASPTCASSAAGSPTGAAPAAPCPAHLSALRRA